jgi:23S rRNA (uridine2552-2'-O)-methyltransferase
MSARPNKKNQWEDHFSRKAKKEGYPARSVYKLEEIQHKYRLIQKGQRILDLGCAPGSWLLYSAKQTGSRGWVVGIDVKQLSVKIPDHVSFYLKDIMTLDESFFKNITNGFHVVLSDMAPATTGSKDVDAARSLNLCQQAFDIAKTHLVDNGSFVCKILQGIDFKIFSDSVKKAFSTFKIFKPQSSRKASREIYFIGMGKK